MSSACSCAAGFDPNTTGGRPWARRSLLISDRAKRRSSSDVDSVSGIGVSVGLGIGVLVGIAVGNGVPVGAVVGSGVVVGSAVDSVARIGSAVGERAAPLAGIAVAVGCRSACTVASIAACTVACVLGVGVGAGVGLASSWPATPSTTRATRRITTRAPIPHQKYEEQPLPEPPALLSTEASGGVLPDPPNTPPVSQRSRLSHSTQVQAAGCLPR